MSLFDRFKSRGRDRPAPDPIQELRQTLADLEADLAATMRSLSQAKERTTVREREAMAAIERADDSAARDALAAMQQLVEESKQLDANAEVLRGMIDECRTVIEAAERAKSPAS